jgi:hypothetical protein
MRSKKYTKKTKTRTRTKRSYKKGGDTSSDIIRLEEGLGPRKDTYVIDIKPSSSPSPRPRARARTSTSSIPPPPFGTPPPLPNEDSESFKSAIEAILPLAMSRKNSKISFPYESVVYNPDDIEGMVHDNRPFPPKAIPVQFEVSPPLAKRKHHTPNILSTFMADIDDYTIPFSDTKPLPSNIVLRDGRVQNQEFNPLKSWSSEKERPSDLAFGVLFGRKRKTKRRNKHSKKHNKKTRR